MSRHGYKRDRGYLTWEPGQGNRQTTVVGNQRMDHKSPDLGSLYILFRCCAILSRCFFVVSLLMCSCSISRLVVLKVSRGNPRHGTGRSDTRVTRSGNRNKGTRQTTALILLLRCPCCFFLSVFFMTHCLYCEK